MLIGIDGYEANVEKRVGIGQYAFQLLTQIQKQDKQNKYLIYLPQAPLADLPKESANWKYVIGKSSSLWTLTKLPELIRQTKPELIWSPTHYSPVNVTLPKIISVMDLSYIYYPETFKLIDLIKLRYLGGWSIKKTDRILTISNFTKDKIVDYYKIDPEKITVTYPGLTSSQSSAHSQQTKLIENKNPYILFVGTIQPRKNIEGLIRAFEMIDHLNLQFLIVGKKGWRYESIFTTWENSSKKDQIRFLDFVTDAELPGLYKNAVCFVLPSLYEGFGIPVVEAMNYGCPVAVSNVSSLPEVAGNLGFYFDPEKPADIAKVITQALQLSKEERQRLAEKLMERARQFSWEECAKKTIAVFNSFR